MLKLVVLSLLVLASPGEQHARALEALDSEEYGTTATILGDLALGHEAHAFDRGGLAVAAGNAWRLEYLHTGNHQAVCAGIELMRSYMMAYQDTAPPVAARYWALVHERNTNNITCTREPVATVEPEPHPVTAPRPPLLLPVAPSSPARADTSPRDTRALKIAGGVLTASAAVGVGVLAGQAVAFAQRLETYRLADGHDPALKARAKSVERWMIGTGVTACVALASGITLLAIAHRAKVRPSLGGLTIQGKF